MKKLWLFIAIALTVLALCGCSQQPQYPDISDRQTQGSPLDSVQLPIVTPTTPVAGLPDGYDPASEEDTGAGFSDGVYDELGNAVYAGSTPIPISPIDKPTATPRPELTFSYGTYTADKIGFTFESAMGYEVDDSQPGLYILSEPAAQQKDGYSARITLQVSTVTSTYKASDIKDELAAQLEEMGAINYKSWSPTLTAERTLLKKTGYYADYRGETYEGVIVRGRIHTALLDGNKLLTLHITCPGWYNSSFMNVYARIRNTLKAL